MSATTFDPETVTTERSADKDDDVPTDGLREGQCVEAEYRTRLDETASVTGEIVSGGRDVGYSGSLRGHRVLIETDDGDRVKVWTTDFGEGRHIEMQTDEGHDATIERAEE